MTRKNVTVEALKNKGFEGICDFSLEQCVNAIKNGDKFNMTNNGAYVRVRFIGEDGWATGDMMRRCTEEETNRFLAERSKNTYKVQRKQFPDEKQDD